MTAAIRARGLARSFGDKRAVRPFDLEIGTLGEGSVTGLLGPNGSGKSTFLRMLLGLVRPDAGSAEVAGVPLAGDGTAIRRRCAAMPGETAVYPELTGTRHLAWLLRGRGGAALERSYGFARDLGLPLERRVRTYSHGMRRMLQLSATLGPEVEVRILDEPTEGLDPTRRSQVLGLLAAEAAAGVSILLSSHHLAEVDQACGRLVFLSDGDCIADERAEDLAERARRLVRLTWDEDVEAARLEGALIAHGAAEVVVRGRRASVVLPHPDPRAFLGALCASDLPQPTSLVYGELSLHELYRDLYGVEGV